jgi:ADP-ribosylglycohydrolase
MAERFRGVLLGTAVGDTLGLPAEGMSRRRVRRRFPGPWRQRLVAGHGMVSDDTEHTVFVAQSLLAHPDSPPRFARRLAWALRGWLLSLPAGIGWATLRAIARLWCGIAPERSGVVSAGNGAAMRVAPIGAFFADAPETLERYVAAATRLTHRDPRALVGARVVARLVAGCVRGDFDTRPDLPRLVEELRDAGQEDAEWHDIVDQLSQAADEGLPVDAFADRLGLERGVSGYVHHTVPVAVYAWHHHFGDFRQSLVSVIECGGDTDTAGAIVGALAGAVVGEAGIPREWRDRILDWPRGVPLLTRLADRLAETSRRGRPSPPVRYCWLGVLPRNLLFLAVVLAHGFRRLAPPY